MPRPIFPCLRDLFFHVAVSAVDGWAIHLFFVGKWL